MISSPTGRRGCLAASAAAVLLALTACGGGGGSAESTPAPSETFVVSDTPSDEGTTPSASAIPSASETPEPSAPEPDAATSAAPSEPGDATPDAPAPSDAAPTLPPGMAASDPVSVQIPLTGVDSQLMHLGLRDNGSLEVPPGEPGSPAAWYDGSPAPGDRGPAVLLGHVNDTEGGNGVFAGLRDLSPGDEVEVAREDGSTATFRVEYGEQYAKNEFPTEKVYGNTIGSELRLITCDGYDPATGEFDDNYVVYAQLVA
ncbi:class F sortase [Rothia sp. AR01]|uniref:Class F sortase n=1 Tax=Rothia santali TaxID=2949643 RepID=A0A9X2HD51_9MICC|nr:class F sortase [Rothia santali]MCP3424969.1 class F sortase [Rothia santali]